MPLETGSRFGSYEILELLNSGNDVEAYKATDTAKSRTVTLKLLPPHISENPQTKERIEREARAISGLSHPNICAVHEVAREGEIDFVVSEYVEGDTLAKRLESGPLPLDEALKVALEIADALNKAHRGKLIHGGLRLSNVVLSAEGAKLIDFGVTPWEEQQKPDSERPASDARSNTTSPDVPDEVLRFMSPEQIRGTAADARSDIFAFGAVLYEMVTGEKAFEGKNRPVLIAAISTLDPDPLSKTQPDVPTALDHVAQRCLEKDPDDRWQTAHDLLVQLRWVAEGGDALFAAARARQKREKRVLALVALVVFLLTVATSQAFVYLGDGVKEEAFQFRVPVAGLSPSDISISPDGNLLALVAKPNTQESSALFVRQVASTEFQRLTGTEDASQPFWSPDSQSIAFVAGGRLKRVAFTGGAPKDLGAASGLTGGTWGTSQVILFGSPKGVFRISAEGGKAEAITTVEKLEAGHFFPSFLPDGQHYLYLGSSMEAANRAIFSAALDSKDKPAKLMVADSNVKYAEPGYLLFHREATLFAQPFDAGKVALRAGDPLHIADQLDFSPTNGRGNFDVSQKGALVYFQAQGGAGGPGGRGNTNTNFQWGWVSRARGSQLTPAGETKVYGDMDLSPNEKLIAVTQSESAGAGSDIWVIDWQNAGRSYRLTTDPGDNVNPVWERPNGDRIAYTTYRKGNADIYIKNANTTGPETPLLDTPNNESIEAWSQDGKYIAYKSGPEGSEDIWVLPLVGDKKPILMVDGPFRKDEPQFSYDGKWLAYASDESAGVFQVYVVSFPGREQKIKVSINGGSQPRWREDGKELFFRTESDNMAMVATITTVGGRIEAGVPIQLFPAPNGGTTTRDPMRHQWAVTRDGQRFLMRTPAQAAAQGGGITAPTINPQAQNLPGATQSADNAQAFVSSGLTVIRNWPAAFQKEAP